MLDGRRFLGLIPARGGSKGLPGKNLKRLAGKPLVAHAVEHAKACPLLDRVVVSTDDEAIAAAGRAAGADVPFMRPAALALDTSSSVDAILHGVDALASAGDRFDAVVLVEPTSPLREPDDLTKAVRLFASRPEARALVSVAPAEAAHPDYCVLLEAASGLLRRLDGTLPGAATGRRQDLLPTFHLAGVVYVSDVETLRAERSFLHGRTLGYAVPRWKAVEVDEPADFVCVEALYEARRRGEIS